MLEPIGLSEVESRLYVTLIQHPRSSAAELALHCGVSTAQAARALALFVRQGMASRLPGRRSSYLAVPPDIALQPLVGRREEELHQVRTAVHELTHQFRRASRYTHPAEQVEVVTGANNILSRVRALQESAKTRIRGIDKPPHLMTDPYANTADEQRRMADGISYRVIYDREVLAMPEKFEEVLGSVRRGEQARAVTAAPLKVWIADDTSALLPMRGDTYTIDAAFVVHQSTLLDAVIALFESEWRRATPVREPAASRSPASPDDETRNLLGLLAAGLTDESIARALEVGLRTVQRRIHDLMRELNVVTRFQLGLAAKDRGWV
ncbi:helix-turn-helix domain-containing protein [Actinophytocola sp.]|uniref:helix-turn-helix domain-containing protein n=1 Tax=Actinophytocola sp. TaxID=1872138 RepID=UPI002ECFD2AD